MMKTRQDNDLTKSIGAVYVENNSKLSWPIRLGANYTGEVYIENYSKLS